MPAQDHADFPPMMEELQTIFDAHQQQGAVRMEYLTRLYFGQLQSGRD
jgi:hypothetical protein